MALDLVFPAMCISITAAIRANGAFPDFGAIKWKKNYV